MKYEIRHICETDYPQIIDLLKEFALFEKLPGAMVNTVDRMREEKEYLNGFVVAHESGEIMGYATYFYFYATWSGKCLYMDDLYVKEKYRHNGLGKKLLTKVIELAKKEKCHKLKWQVSNWNKHAQEFYKRMGATIDDVEINCVLSFD